MNDGSQAEMTKSVFERAQGERMYCRARIVMGKLMLKLMPIAEH